MLDLVDSKMKLDEISTGIQVLHGVSMDSLAVSGCFILWRSLKLCPSFPCVRCASWAKSPHHHWNWALCRQPGFVLLPGSAKLFREHPGDYFFHVNNLTTLQGSDWQGPSACNSVSSKHNRKLSRWTMTRSTDSQIFC